MMKTLLLMRHAKSDWNADYDADHERPLNDRGLRSARLMGRVIAAESKPPHMVVSSTAVRARSTASLANEAGEWGSEIELEAALYGSGADTAIQLASQAPDVDRLMLVGHQPTWSILVSLLTGTRVEMKTGTVVMIDFDIDRWADLPGAEGHISGAYQPGDYLGTAFDEI